MIITPLYFVQGYRDGWMKDELRKWVISEKLSFSTIRWCVTDSLPQQLTNNVSFSFVDHISVNCGSILTFFTVLKYKI